MKKRHSKDRHTEKYWSFIDRRGLSRIERRVFEQLIDYQCSNGRDWFHKNKDEIAEKLLISTDELEKVVLQLGRWHEEYIEVKKARKKIHVTIQDCFSYLRKTK